MSGWKTWTAAGISVLFGVVGLVMGYHDVNTAMAFVVAGLGLVGIGHKIEKSGTPAP